MKSRTVIQYRPLSDCSLRGSLISVYNICSGLYVQLLAINMIKKSAYTLGEKKEFDQDWDSLLRVYLYTLFVSVFQL